VLRRAGYSSTAAAATSSGSAARRIWVCDFWREQWKAGRAGIGRSPETSLGLACKPFSPVAHVLDFLHFLFGNESGARVPSKRKNLKKQRKKKYNAVEQKSALVLKMN
jgi:hypothetical protein